MYNDIHFDFSKACRIDKDEIMECLQHDMDILVECYVESCALGEIVMMPFFKCMLPRKRYAHNVLYNDILVVIKEKKQSENLLEIMPWIDSYIEYMCIS